MGIAGTETHEFGLTMRTLLPQLISSKRKVSTSRRNLSPRGRKRKTLLNSPKEVRKVRKVRAKVRETVRVARRVYFGGNRKLELLFKQMEDQQVMVQPLRLTQYKVKAENNMMNGNSRISGKTTGKNIKMNQIMLLVKKKDKKLRRRCTQWSVIPDLKIV